MRGWLRKQIADSKFCPGWFGLFFNPFYFARRGLFDHISSQAHGVSGKVLDVGAGHKPYRHLFQFATDYVGLELDTVENRQNKQADIYYDGERFPFESGHFDSVLTFQVFEHVFNPEQFLSEINRVLADNGSLLLSVPFVWDEHEQPVDFARYTSFGLRHVLERHGFRIEVLGKTANDVRLLFQMLNCYIHKSLIKRNKFPRLNFVILLTLTAPLNVVGQLLSYILPSNDDHYLDNVVLARKIQAPLVVKS